MVDNHLDLDDFILVVYVCARRTVGVDVSVFRFLAGLFDSSFLCIDVIDYFVKLEKDVSIVGYLSYAAFVGPLIVLSLFAIRTDS